MRRRLKTGLLGMRGLGSTPAVEELVVAVVLLLIMMMMLLVAPLLAVAVTLIFAAMIIGIMMLMAMTAARGPLSRLHLVHPRRCAPVRGRARAPCPGARKRTPCAQSRAA